MPVGAYDMCVVYPIAPGPSIRYRWLTDTEAAAGGNGVRPLDNGPSAANAAISVPLPATKPSPDNASCP